MSQRQRWNATGILILSSICSAGCPGGYRSETVWNTDGSVERAIYQDWDATPEPVRQSKAWKQATAAADPNELRKQGWVGSITELPVKKPGDRGPCFAAWGHFTSPGAIPAHFIRKAPAGAAVPDSQLVREWSQIDYVFVREYRWRETLSDAVTFAEMRQARERLADLSIDLGRDGLNSAFGQDYDVAGLITWLRTEGKTWLAELTDYAYLHAAIRKGPSGFKTMTDGMATICARHGLVLKPRGKFLTDEELDKVLREFVIGKISQHVRRNTDGKPVDKKSAAAFLAELNEDSSDTRKALERAMDQVIVQKYRSKEAFEEQTARLFVRIAGLHWPLLLRGVKEFDYAMTVPGEVVETNGQILSVNKVRWQFDETEAYPLGYVMECRSLLAEPDAQMDLLHNQPLADREKMLEFIALLADRVPLRETLHECRRRKSMMPVYEYYERTAPTKDEREVQAMSRLLKLLKLPSQPDTGKRE